MNRMSFVRNYSTKQKTWCYSRGYYKIPEMKNKKRPFSYSQWFKKYQISRITNKKDIISYSQWFKNSEKPLNRIDRQKIIKKYLDQY